MSTFINGYEPGFCGAEGWEYTITDAAVKCEHDPFYAYTENGIVIVDAGGISYHEYDETDEYGNAKCWCNEKPINTYSDAKNIVDTLEALNLNEFAEYIKLTYDTQY